MSIQTVYTKATCPALTYTLRSRTLHIPFPTPRRASVAQQSISVDKELSPLVRRSFATEGSALRVFYEATTNRMLRVAVNSFMDSLHLVVDVMKGLDVDVLEAARAA